MCIFELREEPPGSNAWTAYCDGNLYGEYSDKGEAERDIKDAVRDRRELGDENASAFVFDELMQPFRIE